MAKQGREGDHPSGAWRPSSHRSPSVSACSVQRSRLTPTAAMSVLLLSLPPLLFASCCHRHRSYPGATAAVRVLPLLSFVFCCGCQSPEKATLMNEESTAVRVRVERDEEQRVKWVVLGAREALKLFWEWEEKLKNPKYHIGLGPSV